MQFLYVNSARSSDVTGGHERLPVHSFRQKQAGEMQSVPMDLPYHNVIMECNLTYFGDLDLGLNPASNCLTDHTYQLKISRYLSFEAPCREKYNGAKISFVK